MFHNVMSTTEDYSLKFAPDQPYEERNQNTY